jgi:AGCS family alanine or glycine:cation symporter
VSSTGTFWDTVVVCLMTGLVVVQSGEWTNGFGGAALTHKAFEDLPMIGPLVLTVGLLTFVFSTILGWAYYGEKACEYLFGTGSIVVYRVLWVIAVMAGSIAPLPAVWAASDITNALMAIPNLISLILLAHVVVAETRTHLWSEDASES